MYNTNQYRTAVFLQQQEAGVTDYSTVLANKDIVSGSEG